ncbi:hypothetical protein [Teichococcus oryzae]|uniref:Glutamine amidotransferase n=1 Tax=Teichococcus oryzae TaxID=1608942 RepID=A0A5B2TAH7_9PROT|nr:hypothetical protein [Pseudoroseomonas oryzae]KAA2211567.1 hypothetical protein F0Q34_19375 [Pseudoroseomonas oryzae]
MFTLEIGGQPIAVIDAEEAEARHIVENEGFRADLQRLQTDGKPLWDGQAPLNLRPATEDEMAAFDDSDDILEGVDPGDEDDAAPEEDDEEEMEVVFLVPLDDGDDED